MSEPRELDEPTVLVVRHGTTGKDDVLKGLMNVGLDPHGHELADHVARHIAAHFPVAMVSHTPLLRGEQTAVPIADRAAAPIRSVDALGPMDVGRMSGMGKDAAAEWLRYYIAHPDKVPPGARHSIGDWFDDFSNFFSRELAEAKRKPGKARVNVTHSSESVNVPSIIRGGGIEYRGNASPAPGSILRLTHRGGRWNMREEKIS